MTSVFPRSTLFLFVLGPPNLRQRVVCLRISPRSGGPGALSFYELRGYHWSMKRVLIFSLTYHPFIGGAEVAIKEITDRLEPSEFSFDMITLRFNSNPPRIEKMGNVTVHRIGFSSPGAKVSDRSMPFVCKVAKALFPFAAFFKALLLNRKKPQGDA